MSKDMDGQLRPAQRVVDFVGRRNSKIRVTTLQCIVDQPNGWFAQFRLTGGKNKFPDKKLSSFMSFLLEQLKLEGLWELAVRELTCSSQNQNVSEGKFIFLDEKCLESSK